MNSDFILAHKSSSKHRAEIEASGLCGFFYCRTTFDAREILEWTDRGSTALCPSCGIDAVIGDRSRFPITRDFLTLMNAHWFGGTPLPEELDDEEND